MTNLKNTTYDDIKDLQAVEKILIFLARLHMGKRDGIYGHVM